MILAMIDDAVAAGAGLERACDVVGITERTVQRWRDADVGDDGRAGPRTRPANALTPAERAKVLAVVNAPEYRDLPWRRLAEGMRTAFILDGRNFLERQTLERAGFRYLGMGR